MKTLQQLLFCLDSYQEVVGSEEEMHKKAEVSPVRMLLENLQHLQGEVSWHFTCKSLNISNIDLSKSWIMILRTMIPRHLQYVAEYNRYKGDKYRYTNIYNTKVILQSNHERQSNFRQLSDRSGKRKNRKHGAIAKRLATPKIPGQLWHIDWGRSDVLFTSFLSERMELL